LQLLFCVVNESTFNKFRRERDRITLWINNLVFLNYLSTRCSGATELMMVGGAGCGTDASLVTTPPRSLQRFYTQKLDICKGFEDVIENRLPLFNAF